MISSLLLFLLLGSASAPATLTVDLDGNGAADTVVAIPRGRKIRIEVQDAAGKRVARAEAPAPGSGNLEVVLTSGALGSAGALLEVSASDEKEECRTIWRLRDRELSKVPVIGLKGEVPECSRKQEWSDHWEKKQEDAPADYVREGTRQTAAGVRQRTEVFRFTGFRLEVDAARSTAKINGVPIPDWRSSTLYPRALVEKLFSFFDLSAFKTAARLRFLTDPEEGIFALQVERTGGSETLPITSSQPGEEMSQWALTVTSEGRMGQVRVQVGSDKKTPIEVSVVGLAEDLHTLYTPVTRFTGSAFEIFQTAEDELAIRSLAGAWESQTGERLNVRSVSASPAVVDFGNERVSLSIARAPRGSDVLLVPTNGAAPRTALLLRGPDRFSRVTVKCEARAAPGSDACRATDRGKPFRRLGTRLNSH